MEQLQLFLSIWGLAGVFLCLITILVLKRLGQFYNKKETAAEYIRLQNNVLMCFFAAFFLFTFMFLFAVLHKADAHNLMIPCGIVLLGCIGFALSRIKKKEN